MRSHRAILRQIAQDNLDPTVAHVSAGNGKLVAREAKNEPNDKERSEKDLQSKTEEKENQANSNVNPENNLEEEVKKKRSFPPRKKKSDQIISE
jgi:hypothetical protein